MRKLLLLLCLLQGSLSLYADEYDYLWVHSPTPSETRSFALDGLWKMTFGSDAFNIYLDGQPEPVIWTYANFLKMTFENEATAAIKTPVTNAGITIRYALNEIYVESLKPLAVVYLYNMQGMRITAFGQGMTSASYPVWSLPAGIYIIRATDGTDTVSRKFVKR